MLKQSKESNRYFYNPCFDNITFFSEVIRQGNSDLLLFEGSKAGKKLYSFTTGGDLLMGRNIIRRLSVMGKLIVYKLCKCF